MKKSRIKISGIIVLAALLVLGMAGCDNSTGGGGGIGGWGGGGGANVLKFTNFDTNLVASTPDFVGVGLFPTSMDDYTILKDIARLANGEDPQYAVAGCDDDTDNGHAMSRDDATNTATMALYSAATGSRWTGTGSYNVWFIAADDENNYIYLKSKTPVTFNGGTKTLNAKNDSLAIISRGRFSQFASYYGSVTPPEFTLTGIDSTQQGEGSDWFSFGLFPTGTPSDIVLADAKNNGTPSAVVAGVGGLTNTLPWQGVPPGDLSISTTLEIVDGYDWNGSGLFDGWVLVYNGSVWNGYKLAINVQGNPTVSAQDFDKIIINQP